MQGVAETVERQLRSSCGSATELRAFGNGSSRWKQSQNKDEKALTPQGKGSTKQVGQVQSRAIAFREKVGRLKCRAPWGAKSCWGRTYRGRTFDRACPCGRWSRCFRARPRWRWGRSAGRRKCRRSRSVKKKFLVVTSTHGCITSFKMSKRQSVSKKSYLKLGSQNLRPYVEFANKFWTQLTSVWTQNLG